MEDIEKGRGSSRLQISVCRRYEAISHSPRFVIFQISFSLLLNLRVFRARKCIWHPFSCYMGFYGTLTSHIELVCDSFDVDAYHPLCTDTRFVEDTFGRWALFGTYLFGKILLGDTDLSSGGALLCCGNGFAFWSWIIVHKYIFQSIMCIGIHLVVVVKVSSLLW